MTNEGLKNLTPSRHNKGETNRIKMGFNIWYKEKVDR